MTFSSFSKDVLTIFKDGIERPLKLSGSLMFIDVKSFTSMVEQAQFESEEKLEELLDRIEHVFTLIHNSVEEEEGEIAFIAGDAMLVYFKNDLTQKRALKAGDKIHKRLKEVELKVKGGITTGDFYIIPVDFPRRRDFVFYGMPLDEASLLEKKAEPGNFLSKDRFFDTDYPSHTRKLTSSPHNSLYNPKVETYKRVNFTGEWRNITSMFLKYHGDTAEFFDFIRDLQENFYPYINAHKIYLDSILMIDKGNHLFFTSGSPETTRYRVKNLLDFALLLKEAYPHKLSIGISNGRAISGFIGSNKFKKFTTIGETVNIAARLMQTAKIDEILFSSESKYFEKVFSFKFYGNIRVKGKNLPLETYLLTGKRSEQLSHGIFVNRTKEIDEIKGFISSHDAGVVLIEGSAGIGKTSLLDRIIMSLKRYRVLKYSAQEHAIERSYSSLKDIINMLYPKPGLPDNIQKFVEEFLVGELTDTKAINTALPGILESLINNLRQHNKVILAIDDWHLVDKASKKVLRSLINRNPCIFMLTARRFDGQIVEHTKDTGILLHLKPLSRQAIKEFLNLTLGGTAHELLIKLMKEKTAGNPLALKHTISYLSTNSMLKLRNGMWITKGTIDVPKDIYDVFLLSFEELPEEEQEELKHLSVFGHSIPLNLFKRYKKYAGLTITLPKNAILNGIVHIKRDIISFTQQTYREAIYESILKHKLREIHKKIAEFMEQHQDIIDEAAYNIARHYVEANIKDKAIYYIDAALSDITYKNDYYKKIELINMKLSITHSPDFKLFETLSNLYANIGLYNKAISTLENAPERNNEERLRKLLSITHLLLDMNEIDKAGELISILNKLRVEQDIPAPNLYVSYNNVLGLYYLNLRKPEKALEYFQQGLKTALKNNMVNQIIPLAGNKASALSYLRKYDEALKNYKLMLKNLQHDTQDVWREIGIYINMANIYQWKDDYKTSIDYYKKATYLSLKNRLYYPYVLAELNLTYVLLSYGKYEEALSELKKLDKYITVVNYKWARGRFFALKGELLAFKGDFENSRKYLQNALNVFLKTNMLHDAGTVFAFLLAFALLERNQNKLLELHKQIKKYPYIHNAFSDFFKHFSEYGFSKLNELATLLGSSLAEKFVLSNLKK